MRSRVMLNEWIYQTRRWICFLFLKLKGNTNTWQHYVFETYFILANSALSYGSSFLTEISVATCQCVLFPRPLFVNVTYENTLYSIFLFNQEELHFNPKLNGFKVELHHLTKKIACFVLYLKIINTFLKNYICIL